MNQNYEEQVFFWEKKDLRAVPSEEGKCQFVSNNPNFEKPDTFLYMSALRVLVNSLAKAQSVVRSYNVEQQELEKKKERWVACDWTWQFATNNKRGWNRAVQEKNLWVHLQWYTYESRPPCLCVQQTGLHFLKKILVYDLDRDWDGKVGTMQGRFLIYS